MNQQLLDKMLVAYTDKDFITLYESFPKMLREIKRLECQIETMARLIDYNGDEPIEVEENS